MNRSARTLKSNESTIYTVELIDYLKQRLFGEVDAAEQTLESDPAVLCVHVHGVFVEPALRREGLPADITLVLLRFRGVLRLK